ncbi:hypothetical protein [Mesorhizobium sp.]|nr:hypothetical protein [Mesorhizobium sp.]
MAIETSLPDRVLPSRPKWCALYSPAPFHEAEALAKAIIGAVEN